MLKRALQVLIASLAVGLILACAAPAASAYTALQSPSVAPQLQSRMTTDAPQAAISMADGRCGFESRDVDDFYQSLKREGVLDQAIDQVFGPAGYSRVDGSLLQWMRDRLVITRTQQVTTIEMNYGCRSGELFRAGPKTLPKGWPIVVLLPSRYSKSDISTKPKHGYKRTTLRCVLLVAQASCDNPGKARCILIVVWVKVEKPTPKPRKFTVYLKKVAAGSNAYFTFPVKIGNKPAKTIRVKANHRVKLGTFTRPVRIRTREVVPSGWKLQGSNARNILARGNMTITYTNVKIKPPARPAVPKCSSTQIVDSNTNTCVDIDQRNVCGPNNVINGNGNSVNTTINCGDTQICVGTNVCNQPPESCHGCCGGCPPPPPQCTGCECLGNCPPPPVEKAKCLNLSATVDGDNGLLVRAVTTVSVQNASFVSAVYNWGDGTRTTGGLSTSYTYSRAGTYRITVTPTFRTASGRIIVDDTGSCWDEVTATAKDGRPGAGDGNSGDPTDGHPGAGDSGTAPSYDCFLEDGNGDPDPDRPGYYNPATRRCQSTPVSTRT